jgi:hypothetical protein
MDSDAVMLYIKDNPDCSSLDIAREFDITVARAFTIVNDMVQSGLAFKTIVRSPTNGKKILGYRVIPQFDEVGDNGDGSMKEGVISRDLKRLTRRGEYWKAAMTLASHNDWRDKNGLPRLSHSLLHG